MQNETSETQSEESTNLDQVPDSAAPPQPAKRVSIDKATMATDHPDEEEEEEDDEDMSHLLKSAAKSAMLLMVNTGNNETANVVEEKPTQGERTADAVDIQAIPADEEGTTEVPQTVDTPKETEETPVAAEGVTDAPQTVDTPMQVEEKSADDTAKADIMEAAVHDVGKSKEAEEKAGEGAIEATPAVDGPKEAEVKLLDAAEDAIKAAQSVDTQMLAEEKSADEGGRADTTAEAVQKVDTPKEAEEKLMDGEKAAGGEAAAAAGEMEREPPVQAIPIKIDAKVQSSRDEREKADISERSVTVEEKQLPDGSSTTTKVVKEYQTKTVTVEGGDQASTEMARQMLDQLESSMAGLMADGATGLRLASTSVVSKQGEPVTLVCDTETVATDVNHGNVEPPQRKSSAAMATQTDVKEQEKSTPIRVVQMEPTKTEAVPTSLNITMSGPGTVTKKTVQRTETKKTYISKKQINAADWIQQESVTKNNWISGAPWTRGPTVPMDVGPQQPASPTTKPQFFQKSTTTTTRTENFTSDGQSEPKHWVTQSKQVYTDKSAEPVPPMGIQQTLQEFSKQFETSQQQQQSTTKKTEVPPPPPPSQQQQQQPSWRMKTAELETAAANTLEDFKKRFEQQSQQQRMTTGSPSPTQGHIRSEYSYSSSSSSNQQWRAEAPLQMGTDHQKPADFVRNLATPDAHTEYSYSSQQWKTADRLPFMADLQTAAMPTMTTTSAVGEGSPIGMVKRTTTYTQQRTESRGQQRPAEFGLQQTTDDRLPAGPFGRMPISRTVTSGWTSKVSGQQSATSEQQFKQHQQHNTTPDQSTQPTEHHWSVSSVKRYVNHGGQQQ